MLLLLLLYFVQLVDPSHVFATTVLRKFNNQWRIRVHHSSAILTSRFTDNAKEYPPYIPPYAKVSLNGDDSPKTFAASKKIPADISTTGIPNVIILPRKSTAKSLQGADPVTSLMLPLSSASNNGYGAVDDIGEESVSQRTFFRDVTKSIPDAGMRSSVASPSSISNTSLAGEDESVVNEIVKMLQQITGKLFSGSANSSQTTTSKPVEQNSTATTFEPVNVRRSGVNLSDSADELHDNDIGFFAFLGLKAASALNQFSAEHR
jgi:hypothetical protein